MHLSPSYSTSPHSLLSNIGNWGHVQRHGCGKCTSSPHSITLSLSSWCYTVLYCNRVEMVMLTRTSSWLPWLSSLGMEHPKKNSNVLLRAFFFSFAFLYSLFSHYCSSHLNQSCSEFLISFEDCAPCFFFSPHAQLTLFRNGDGKISKKEALAIFHARAVSAQAEYSYYSLRLRSWIIVLHSSCVYVFQMAAMSLLKNLPPMMVSMVKQQLKEQQAMIKGALQVRRYSSVLLG